MVNFVKPRYTKSKVRSAGKRIVKNTHDRDDIAVLENFRGAHAYILNTFQANIRNHSRGVALSVGQRLKRRNTIIDKLQREPNMPLYAMHDVAGCRIVLKDIPDLERVRFSMHGAKWRHELKNEIDRYNYIKNPKCTGYRGIHDVYEYNVNSVGGTRWNGLKVEIQYRTMPQHAWATAVEIADLVTSNRIKFSDAAGEYLDYFMMASEVISRTSEGLPSCFPDISNRTLRDDFRKADKKLGLITTFDNLRASGEQGVKFRKNMILVFKFATRDGDSELHVFTYDSVNDAVEAYDEKEKEYGESADIVLVRGENEESIRDAFRNYFSDARAFVDLIRTGLQKL